MKLRPYHNPENVDESKVPYGWRFRYADEAGRVTPRCRPWWPSLNSFKNPPPRYFGDSLAITYIVPVTP